MCVQYVRKRSQGRIFNNHLKAHYPNSPTYLCQICWNFYTRKSCLDRHSLSHQREKMHECCICGKTLLSKCSLRKHSRTHEDKRECVICNKLFVHLEDHMKQCGQEPTFFQCDTCGKQFRQRRYLREHSRSVHSNQKQYECNMCGN